MADPTSNVIRPFEFRAPRTEESSLVSVSEGSREAFLTATREIIDLLSARVLKNRGALEEYILLGRVYRLRGEPKRALRLHRNLMARPALEREVEIALLTELGFDLLEAGMSDLGESSFQRALTLQKHHVRAMEGLVKVYETRGEYEKAIGALRRLVALGRPAKAHLAFVYSELAQTYLKQGELAKARRTVNRGLKFDESCPYAHLTLADIFLEANRHEKAIDLLKDFLRRWPHLSFLSLRRLEDAHYRKNAFPAYENTLRECIRSSPDNFYLHYSLARHLRKKRKKEEAIEFLRRCLELNPRYVNAVRDRMEMLAERDGSSALIRDAYQFLTAFKRSRRFICPNCRRRYVPVTWRCGKCGFWGVFEIRYELPAP